MSQADPNTPLTPLQVQRIQKAVATVIKQHGWGQVSLVVMKGRVVGIKTEVNENID